MSKIGLIILNLWIASASYAQSKEVDKAKDYLAEHLRTRNLSDIELAYSNITEAMKLEKNQMNDFANFYNGKIIKLYFDAKGLKLKKDLVLESYRSLSKTLEINPKFLEKVETLKLIQFICFDLYNEGIFLFNENRNEEAYNVYKVLMKAQELLKKNNLKIEMQGANNTSALLTDADIMNNYAIFCMNSGKMDEAKGIMLEDIKSKPTAPKYLQLVNLFRKLQDGKSADLYIAEALNKYPDDIDVLILNINSNIEKKNTDLALNQVTKAIKMKPTNYELYLVQGQLYSDKEQYQASIDAYKSGLALFPNNYDLNYNLGRAYFNLGTQIYNLHDIKRKPEAVAALDESKKSFLKAKSIDASKVDIDKIIQDINLIK